MLFFQLSGRYKSRCFLERESNIIKISLYLYMIKYEYKLKCKHSANQREWAKNDKCLYNLYSREYGVARILNEIFPRISDRALLHDAPQRIVRRLQLAQLRRGKVFHRRELSQPRLDLLLSRLTTFRASFSTRLLSIDRAVLCRSRIL